MKQQTEQEIEVEKLKAIIATLETCLSFGQEWWVKSFPKRRNLARKGA